MTLEVAQSELRSPIPIVSDNNVSPHGLLLASVEQRFTKNSTVENKDDRLHLLFSTMALM